MDKNSVNIAVKDQFIVGRNPILDALKAKKNIEKVWIDKGIRGPFEKELRFLCREAEVQLQVVPKEKLDYISRIKAHQGVAAQISHIEYYDLDDVVQWCYEQGKAPFILMTEGIEDVRNFGALARTALWFGAHAMVVPLKGGARINAGAIKSSAGALLKLRVCKVASLSKAIQQLKGQGLNIIAADMNGTNDLANSIDINQGLALIMGSEGKGISSNTRKLVDHTVSIPGKEQMESLNVSVATGILMHDIYKLIKENI